MNDNENIDENNMNMNNGEEEQKIDGQLIYNEEQGYQDMEKLFNDDDQEYDTYEIEFKILDKNKNPQKVTIELQKIKYKKPYFGGFVNKTNGTYYYHAYAQTDQYKNEHKLKENREAQTYEYKTRSTKQNREFGTQMAYVGLYIDNRQDKELQVTEYFTADKWEEKRNNTVIYLQKMMRGFFARKTCRELRKEKEDEVKQQEQKEEEERKEQEKNNKREIQRRMHPKTNMDFKLLKDELDAWVQSETIRIKSSNLSEEDKTLALQELLHKEISLLQSIEKLKISANKENRTEKIAKFLEKMSADKKWKAYDGHYVNVQTVLTLTAAKLEKQFKKLNQSTSVDVRLANLLEFKKLMEEHNKERPCSLIQKILELIERESDMLQRGRPDSSLEGLRQRLNNLYLSFIETPTFNPEAQRFQIIPKDYLLDIYRTKD
jgi:hypothetical protein